LPKSKRLLLTAAATAAVAAAGTWGAVAMAASSPGSKTPSRPAPKSQTTPRAHSAQHHNCPNMGNSPGASSSTMYSPSDV